MASFNWEQTLLLLLQLVSILQLVGSELLCRIEIDSVRRLWRDVTQAPSYYQQATSICISYSYRETGLQCTSARCPPVGLPSNECNVYYNADTYWPCLATCKEGCPHGLSCDSRGTCPCSLGEARYQAKMCVPYHGVKKCTNGHVFVQGQCVSPNWIDFCPNGLVDEVGGCKCNEGFSTDPKTKKCVVNECLNDCKHGTCQVYGDCTCNDGLYKEHPQETYNCYTESQCHIADNKLGFCGPHVSLCNEGFKNDPKNYFKCVPINCPYRDHNRKRAEYCTRVCQDSSCTRDNGFCDNGECKCHFGSKKSSPESKCEPIRFPDENELNYCTKHCSIGGKCNINGECLCNDGYKKDSNYKYFCSEIICPSFLREDDVFCKTKCDKKCENGVCDNLGGCKCNKGFKLLPNDLYNCSIINCTATTPADKALCECIMNCNNGKCNEAGACQCNEGFVSTNLATNVSCHLQCHEDDSCNSIAWIGIISCVCVSLVVAIIVAIVVVVRRRKRGERASKDQVQEMQEVPAGLQVDDPEYANYDAQEEGETEENGLYQSFDSQLALRRVQ